MKKIRFRHRLGSDLWAIAGIDDIILCTPKERRKIQSLKVGQKFFFQDWARFFWVSREISGDQITEDKRR